jgi:hypothetical protein
MLVLFWCFKSWQNIGASHSFTSTNCPSIDKLVEAVSSGKTTNLTADEASVCVLRSISELQQELGSPLSAISLSKSPLFSSLSTKTFDILFQLVSQVECNCDCQDRFCLLRLCQAKLQ